jgi:hypothetical protein
VLMLQLALPSGLKWIWITTVPICSWLSADLEQEAEEWSWRQVIQQPIMNQEKSESTVAMSPSSRSGRVYASWNHDPPGTQHFPQGTEMSRIHLVSAEAPRQVVGEMRS